MDSDRGHLHGNFANYYAFHPPQDRLGCLAALRALLRHNRDGPLLVADLGCNTGELTASLAEHLAASDDVAVEAVGIDIDGTLIARANAREASAAHSVVVEYVAGDLSGDAPWRALRAWAAERRPAAPGFDLVCCFSTTMWIHLHGGDDGLAAFLHRAADLVAPCRGALLVEPQPWRCYRNARKRQRRRGVSEDFPAMVRDGAIADKAPEAFIDRVLLAPPPSDCGSGASDGDGADGGGADGGAEFDADLTAHAGAGRFRSVRRFAKTTEGLFAKRVISVFHDLISVPP